MGESTLSGLEKCSPFIISHAEMSVWEPGMHLKGSARKNVPSNVTVWGPSKNPFACRNSDKTTYKGFWEIHLLATWRCCRPAFLRRTCSLDGAKSSGAVTGNVGLFLNALARDQMLPVRAVEGAGRQRFSSGTQRAQRAQRTTSLQLFCCCLRCWSFL